jgi:hypothetical protein
MNNILKWAGCLLVLAGAVCTSLKICPLNVILLNLGSFCYFIWGVRIREMNIWLLNLVLLIIYGIGICL